MSQIAKFFQSDKIGVIPTDTIYGVVASAFSKKAVEWMYKILKRNPKKPFIILISSLEDLEDFNVKPDENSENILRRIWPGKISVIMPVSAKKFSYLHRGTKTLAFRLPKNKSLLKILKKTGPLVSSSANPQGKKPAETVAQAKKYFSGKIDFYADGGKMKSLPSTLIEIKEGKINVVRQGAKKITKNIS